MNTVRSDLFGVPPVAGFRHCDAIVTPDEEKALIGFIDAAGLTPFSFQGWEGKRLTASFGWRYDFNDASFRETVPMPDWLLPLRERAASFAHLSPEALVQALVIRYDPGAGIGWHRDRPVFGQIVGISLGNVATMRFRRRHQKGFDRFSALLEPRSIYGLADGIRYEWEHSIAPMEVPRWSITFRSLAARGHAFTARS